MFNSLTCQPVFQTGCATYARQQREPGLSTVGQHVAAGGCGGISPAPRRGVGASPTRFDRPFVLFSSRLLSVLSFWLSSSLRVPFTRSTAALSQTWGECISCWLMACLFVVLIISSGKQKFLILRKSSLSVFFFLLWIVSWVLNWGHLCLTQGHKDFGLVFF